MAISDAIILSFREQVRATLKDMLKRKNIANVVCSDTVDSAISDLTRFPKAMVIVDWDIGSLDTSRVLTANMGDTGLNLRPLMIIADAVNAELVATSVEFGVSQITADFNNRSEFEAKVGGLIRTSTQRNEIRTELTQVAKLKKAGNFAGAITLLQGVLKKNSQNLMVKAELAECFLRDDQVGAAKETLEPMPEMNPPNLRYLHVYGRCLMRMSEHERAIEILEKANLYNPNHAERLIDLGHALIQTDQFKEAAQAFDQALQVSPSIQGGREGKGQALLLDGSLNEALEVMEGSVDPVDMASVFNLSAVFCIRKSRFEEGMSLYRAALRALDKRPKLLAKLYFNMGIGFFRQNDFGGAKRHFEQAVIHDAGFTKAKRNLLAVEQRLAAEASNLVSKPASVEKIDTDFDEFESEDLTEGLEDSIGF